MLVALAAYLGFSAAHPARAQILGTDDRERVEIAVSSYFDPFTIAPQPSVQSFANVAVKGDGGAGGPDTGLPSSAYTVQPGDTLSDIAAAHGYSSATLIIANSQLQGSDMIHPGQVLNIPAQAASGDQLSKLKAAAVPANSASSALSGSVYHKVVSGVSAGAAAGYGLPVRYQYESQGFSSSHPGRDMVAPYGTPIRATKDGCIISASSGWSGGYGNLVVEDLGGGITARYAHLSAFQKGVTAGDCVSKGDVIGYLGSTGNSTGPHLHFELRLNGVAFDSKL